MWLAEEGSTDSLQWVENNLLWAVKAMHWGLWRCSVANVVSRVHNLPCRKSSSFTIHLKKPNQPTKKPPPFPPSHDKCATVQGRQPACSLPVLSLHCQCLSGWLINCHSGNASCPPACAPLTATLSCLSGNKQQKHREATVGTILFHRIGDFSPPEIFQMFLHSQGPLSNMTKGVKRSRSTRHSKQGQCWRSGFFFCLPLKKSYFLFRLSPPTQDLLHRTAELFIYLFIYLCLQTERDLARLPPHHLDVQVSGPEEDCPFLPMRAWSHVHSNKPKFAMVYGFAFLSMPPNSTNMLTVMCILCCAHYSAYHCLPSWLNSHR